jgi:predicted N-acetyltransferase YhbS
MNATVVAKESVIRGCNGQVELVSVVDLLDRAYGNTPREYFERHLLHDPTLRLRDTRILLRDDRIVSTVQIFPRVMQVAGTELPFGGIGNMATEPSERRSGYAAVMMNDAIDEMRAEGFPLSMLITTINAYYERFGYRTIARCVATIAPLPGTMHPAVRRFRRETDYARVKELYRKYTAHSIGPLVRDELYWEAQFTFCGEDPGMFLVLEEGGTVVAYVRARVADGHLEIMEFASEQGFAPNFDVLLRSLCSLAPGLPIKLYYAEREQERLRLQYPWTKRDDTDLMILVLDNRIASTVEQRLMRPDAMTYWLTDLF